MNDKRKTFDADVREVGARALQFVISTRGPDRDGDNINQRGWLLDNFKANPVVLWAHDYKALPVGKATEIGVRGDQLMATVQFVPAEIYPLAETVFQMLKAGFLRATSVGFRPLKWHTRADGIDFDQQELLEFSIVPVPANPEALIVSRGANPEAVRSWLRGTQERQRANSNDDDIVLELEDDPVVLELVDPLDDRAARRDVFDVDRAEVVAEIRNTVPGLLRAELARSLPGVIDRALRQARGRVD
jgi:HK97 family phage prohead protease